MNLADSNVRFWNPDDGTPLNGYAVWSPLLPSLPAIVLVPDVYGVQEEYRELARRFAREGFLVLVVNPYSRTGVPDLPDRETAEAWIDSFPDRSMRADVMAAVSFARGHERVRPTSVAVAGFGTGGQYAFMAACTDTRLRACVTWYATLRYQEYTKLKPADALDLSPDLHCPYLGFFAAGDSLVPACDVEELGALLKHFRKHGDIHVYAEAAAELPQRPHSYRGRTAGDSWPRALAFLHRHLEM